MLTSADSAAAARNASPPDDRGAALAGEDAAQDRPVVTRLDDGEDEQHPAARLEESIEAPVEQLPDGRVDSSQRLLDPVDGAEEMAALDRLTAAEPDRDVLRVAAEARHLVRHDLPDRDDEVVGAVDERAVDGERQREAQRATDDVVDLVRRKLTDRVTSSRQRWWSSHAGSIASPNISRPRRARAAGAFRARA